MLSRSIRIAKRFSKKGETDTSASERLKEELTNNPYFDRAFPHLSGYKQRSYQDIPKEELGFIKSLL